MLTDLLEFETEFWAKGHAYIAGVDEAGRGPLAGPVVASAVIFSRHDFENPGIKDSKLLSIKKRTQIAEYIRERALCVGIGICEHDEIDRLNILKASLLAMQRAVNALSVIPDQILVDGRNVLDTTIPCEALIKGDLKSRVIAAASVIAKVERDCMMIEYDRQYPEYGFARHKGYPTKHHVEAIEQHGLSPIHRRSFRVKALDGIEL
ncbi:MAG: ribonuclease HII [candidate division KSB1 bacterium]|nr:ribonuclease HII [candidate division KSB1 bacterium]